MRRGALVTLCLLASVLLAPGTRPASATPAGFSVSGDGVGTYPAFDPGILRYAVTTTADTGGSVTVTVPSGSSVDGVPASGPVTVTDLSEGDEVAVGVGGSSYALVYLPPDFPALAVTTPRDLQAQLAPGYVGLGLTTFGAGPSFDTIIDRNGVPIWLRRGATSDLKRQPDGDLTVFRPTSDPDHSGSDLVTLNDQFQEIARQRMANGLPDTDNHDAVELADGSTILIGYEPRGEPTTGHLDAIIQKIDRPGHVLFQWSSQGLETESLNPLPWPPLGSEQRIDYAHINSVQEIGDGTHDLLVSFRHFSAVYRIATQDRTGVTAGDIIWRLGGRHSDFAFVDDPDNGPCAQHTANMLLDQPDGHDHVLVFDNGSGPNGQSVPGCVDPGAPLGPGISRQHTRIAEWSLDTGVTPHTATLVWSYQPKIYDPGERDPFSFFAGSARRLDNGDTLIGWADERAMLASEVGADKSLLWQVQTPPTDTPHATRYATYRASLIPYTDAIDPTVTISVADRATYRAGALPVLHWSCTDRGGSNLAGCSTSGLANGQLVPTPGTHTFSITGTDGAGNHRTVVRSYRVIAADGLMRREGGAWVGGNIYGSTSVQTIRQRVARRHTATSHWRVQNDAAHAGVFALAGVGSTHRFRVRYFADGVDVTRAVVAGTFRTPTLAPGAWTSVRVAVTPTRHARPGRTRTIRLHASSPDGAGVDSVAAVVTVRR